MSAILLFQTVNALSPKLNKKKSVYVGNTYKLKIQNASNVKWLSGNVKDVMVNSKGIVTDKKLESTTISAKYKNKIYRVTVVVKNVKLNKKSITISRGLGYPLEVLKTTGKMKWNSSNPTIVKVNKNGYISNKRTRKTLILVKSKDVQ